MAKTKRLPTTGSERWQHLQEQLGFLRRSCRDFDDGHVSEAKRMANETIKLVFNEGSFKAVLHQVGLMPGMGFISTNAPGAGQAGPSLLLVKLGASGVSYEAPTDKIPHPPNRPRHRILTFAEWWNETVITFPDRLGLARWNIVRSLRDQQGGGHVDPTLDEDMAELQRGNPIRSTWSVDGTHERKIPDVELHTMRQIAHEVLISIERKLSAG